MAQLTRTINQFEDAASVAVGLHQLYGRFAAAALLDDDDGTIIDMRPFAGEEACVVCALEWALDVADDWSAAHKLVLLSGGAASLRNVREDDIRLYQGLREELGAGGIELIDWIQTDGNDIRSLTFTCDITSNWDDQPRAS